MLGSILVVAREPALRARLSGWLQSAGYEVEIAESVPDALRLRSGRTFLLVLDATDGSRGGLGALARKVIAIPPSCDNGGQARLLAEVGRALAQPPGTKLLRFAGCTLDLDGCALLDAQGKPVDLTRGEFVMLRTFAQQPSVVLSREQLLDAIAGRRADPFDRSVDMMVGRLRRKIEPDPKQPTLIVTVPGLGYKFAAKVVAGEAEQPAARDATGPSLPVAVDPRPPPEHTALPPASAGRRRVLVGGGAALAALAAAGGVWFFRGDPAAAHPVTITVPPFSNLGGDAAQDYFAEGIAIHLSIQLGTFPAMQVIAAPTLQATRDHGAIGVARAVGADYVLEGGFEKGADKVRITAQLFETMTGGDMWADRFDGSGADMIAMQEDIADRIYQSISGFRGIVYQKGIRDAWRKATPSLGEYDYAMRGHAFYFRFNKADVLTARRIWQDGLRRFPESALLRTKIALSYMWMFMNNGSDDIDGDVARSWELVRQSDRIEPKSPLVAYMNHWTLAIVCQWRGEDFVRSIAEAREALKMAPYDTMLRSDVSWCMANAGLGDEAVAHALWAVQHAPSPPGWFFGNLGWAYYVAGRYAEALETSHKAGDGFAPTLAATLVRLGRLDEARAVIVAWRKSNPRDSIAAEARWPLIEPYKKAMMQDLRTAGLPEA